MPTKSTSEREEQIAKAIADMPEAYKTPAGRIVRANKTLHTMIVRQRGGFEGFVPCELPKKKAPAKKAPAKKADAE